MEIHKLITSIWKKEKLPEEWKELIIVPIQKKGDKTGCNNYRGTSLLPTTYKMISNILLSRLIPYAKEISGDHQCGFRRNRSTIDHIFCIHEILRKKGNTMKTLISSLTSRKLMIQLGERSYIRFSLSLVSPENL